MSEHPRDREVLEPLPLQSAGGVRPLRKIPGRSGLLMLLLTLWAGGVFWYFRLRDPGPPPPEPLPELPVTLIPPEIPSTPVLPPTATPVPAAVGSRLRIESDPPGAAVLVGGRLLGVTPLEIPSPPPGEGVLLRRTGFAPARLSVPAHAGERVLRARLEPLLGRLRIEILPSDALLFLDGKPTTLPHKGEWELPLRPHQLRVEAAGFESRELELAPLENYTREYRMELLPKGSP